MKPYTRKNLNVKRLLELGDLDIRGIAAENEKLSANSYFSLVEQVIEIIPQLRDILLNLSRLEENLNALKELESKLGVTSPEITLSKDTKKLEKLENIQKTLNTIGCKKLDFDIECIIKAIKNDDVKLTEKMAAEACVIFDALAERMKSAQIIKKFTNAEEDNSNENEGEIISLKEALARLDHEEATRKMRILAVDDVSVVLNTIVSVLSPYYEVFALKNASMVERFLAQATPELFLLDIEMGEMSGFELMKSIRQLEKHKTTPIMFLTGNATYSNLKDAVALGACDFITKPVNKDVLLEKIAKNIVRKRSY